MARVTTRSTKTPDERFKDDLEAQYDAVMKVIKDALESKQNVRVQRKCHKCGCQHIEYVEVQDIKAAMAAAEFLANRGIGRPGTVEPGERQVVHNYVFEYVTPVEDAA